MSELKERGSSPRVHVLADVASNAESIIERHLKPGGIAAWPAGDANAPVADVLVIDVTQLRGDPLAGLRIRRADGDEAPAIVLAAHLPTARLRDLFRLGVADVLLKPYKAVELCRTIYALGEARSNEVTTQLLARRLQSSREQARRRSEEIRMLSEIGRSVIRLRSLDDILTRVVEAAAFLTEAEEADVYLADPHTNEIVLRASKSAGEARGSLKRLRIPDSLAGRVFRTGRPFVRQAGSDGQKVKVQTGFLVESLANVPIRISDQVVGVLGAYNRVAARPFSDHHVTLLGALADWTGVALEQRAKAGQIGHSPVSVEAPPAEQPTPEAPTTQVTPDVIAGLDRLQAELGRLLRQGQLEAAAASRLQELQALVEQMLDQPMAVLEPDAASSFIELDALAERVVTELRLAARRRDLELVFEVNGRPPRMRGDRNRAHRVIEALTAAAIRRTQRGTVSLKVQRFSVQAGYSPEVNLPLDAKLSDGLWVGVRVSDSSSGLSPDTVKALSAPQANPDTGHLGPGLSMGEIRMIAESMGGHLWHEHTSASTSIMFALPAR